MKLPYLNWTEQVSNEDFRQYATVLADVSTTNIGRGLRILRERYAISQVKLADRLSLQGFTLSAKSISKIENGVIKNKTHVILCTVSILKALNTDIQYLKDIIIITNHN